MSTPLAPVLDRLDSDFDAALRRLCALLRIPSISTDPKYRPETRRAAAFVAEDLASIGFDTEVHETPGHPIVTGHFKASGAAGAPRILYYGHYDVQPPDPLELWESGPFEPAIVDGPHGQRVVARGAVDDKGQLMTFVEAFRAWVNVHGALPVEVTVLLEGEEETGSTSLEPFLKENAASLGADVCVISDTSMWNIDTPAITYMLRGLLYAEATLFGPSHDLHSGMYGGAVVNPAMALARILGSVVDGRGVIQIPHLYDDVRELSPEEAAAWAHLGFDEAAFMASAGLTASCGEAGRSLLERLWARPTFEINGIWAGYTGQGAKTVIPARASAKLSCRLVPDQDPRKVYDGLVAYLRQRTPPDCRWEVALHSASRAVRVPTESACLEAAGQALERVFGRKPVLIGCGGSIPVVGSVQRVLGFDSLLVGFGLEDDRVHSPNEKFELRCFRMGMRSHAAMLGQFAAMPRPRTGKLAGAVPGGRGQRS